MKNVTSYALASLFIILLASGCKKDNTTGPAAGDTGTPGTASFTLNGAGFSNLTVNLTNAMGGFSAADNMSAIVATNMAASDTTMLQIAFPGSTTGTFPFTDSTGVVISRQVSGTTRGFANYVGGGQIVVTSFGAVATGSIVGTFSGKLYEVTQSGLDSVTVSNGKFNAVRVQ